MPKEDLVLDVADDERRTDTVLETYSPAPPNDSKGKQVRLNVDEASESTPLMRSTQSQRDLHSRIDAANNISLFVNAVLCLVKLYAFIVRYG